MIDFKDVVEELRMQISIGQALGIKTAGDRLRAAERAALRRGKKLGVEQEREKSMNVIPNGSSISVRRTSRMM